KKAIVFGAGISGMSAMKILETNDYEVILVDDKIGMSSSEAIKILDEVSLFVKSPGIPYVEIVKKSLEKNIEVINEIEVSYRELKKKSPLTKIIAITGTNGKTTTTAKIAELINFSGMKAEPCGNIGKAFGEIVLKNEELDYVVLELSSFQLENLKEFKADIALVINLTPDHIDRYTSLDDYYDVKFNIVNNQTKEDYFVINLDDKESIKRIHRVKSKKIKISKNKTENSDIFVKNNGLIYNETKIIDIDKLSLKGEHNLENMMFVAAVAKIIGIKNEVLEKFLCSTKSIEHRLEDFFKTNEITFINDSKGTNIDSTKFALEAYPNSILICGGKDKKLNLLPLAKLIKQFAKEVYLIGENSSLIITELEKIGFEKERIFDLKNLKNCIVSLKDRLNLNEKNNILFSPATSSYDQFKNYEERGKEFKKMIRLYFGG
ncbi:MAG: UDP-N-acetylmuramoyl-L-alanine--D-glutamate ligase, partial [Fusobacteriaceae bacterium]